MVTKAEIQYIDFTGNTCIVRMPYFENAVGSFPATATAIFANTPGSYNGYKVGDIVLVAFEDGQAQTPVVIGKLYLGAAIEAKEARGAINCNSFISEQNNTLPLTTKIESTIDNGIEVDGGATTYKTLREVLNTISNQAILIENLTARVAELEKKD